jgi:hypothetical protein
MRTRCASRLRSVDRTFPSADRPPGAARALIEPALRAELPQTVARSRAIQASPGKLDLLHGRLREHQIPLLKEDGVFTQAAFVPAGENPQELVYLLTAAEGLGPMEEGWAEFCKDPKWLKTSEQTDSDGSLVARERNQRLVKTFWSPQFKPEHAGEPRVFELRT